MDLNKKNYLENWLKVNKLTTKNVWREMDKQWDIIFNNKNLNLNSKLEAFYKHEVWELNAYLTSKDKIAVKHRKILIDYLKKSQPNLLLDYGGGKGILATMIDQNTNINQILIYEPYSGKKIDKFINFKHSNTNLKFSAITCIDVLEHIPDPLKDIEKISRFLDSEGVAIFANCFYPVIKCHLFQNMWLRHLFPIVTWSFNLERQFTLKGARHICVYKKNNRLTNLKKLFRYLLSKKITLNFIKLIGYFLNFIFIIPNHFIIRFIAFLDKK